MSHEICRAHLAAIFVTLLSITSVSLFGLSLAQWPQEPPRAEEEAAESSVSATPQSFDGESSFVPAANERGRTKWM